MHRVANKIAELWSGWSIEQRFAVLALSGAALVLVVGAVLAIRDFTTRPGDITNTEVSFQARETPKAPILTKTSDWPRFGLDRARTKYMNAPKVKPPFVRRWNYDRGELIEFAPIIVDGTLYGIDNDAVVFALDADTGKEVWKRPIGSLNASSPAYSGGRLFAVTLAPRQVVALRARDGRTVWRKSLPSRAESSPLYHNGRIYFGTEGGEFFALRTKDGKTIWQTKLAGSVKAAPAYLGGSLYVGDYAGDMYAIRASDGRIRWRAGSLGGSFGRGGRFYSTPAVAFGRVYAGNVDGRVYSFDRRTGEVAWTRSAGHFVYSGIAAADTERTRPTVYYGSHDGKVYAVDARTGQARWSERAGGQVSGPATVIGQIAYASTFSGRATVGFDVETGNRRFKVGIGQYGPAVSDAVRLYIVGGDEIRAYDPVTNVPKSVKGKESSLGVLSTTAYRKAKRLGGAPARSQRKKPAGPEANRSQSEKPTRERARPTQSGFRFEGNPFGLEPAKKRP